MLGGPRAALPLNTNWTSIWNNQRCCKAVISATQSDAWIASISRIPVTTHKKTPAARAAGVFKLA